MRIGLVANPSSGRGRHNGAAEASRRALLGAGHDVLLVEGAHYEEARACATGLLDLNNNPQKKDVSPVDFFCIGFGAIVGVGLTGLIITLPPLIDCINKLLVLNFKFEPT